jgi:hypothetical protein
MKLLNGWLQFFGLMLLLVALGGLGNSEARDTLPGPQTPALSEYTNPNTYCFGTITEGAILQDGHYEDAKYATVLIVAPFNTPLVYTENIVLCGDLSAQLKTMGGPVVMTYSTKAHQTFKGVGCHNLIGISHVVMEDQ